MTIMTRPCSWHTPLFQLLGIFTQQAATAETISDTIALTFVCTVLLMIISGIAMWLVYGRASKAGERSSARRRAKRMVSGGSADSLPSTTTAALPNAAKKESERMHG